jgi:hypothetical protein
MRNILLGTVPLALLVGWGMQLGSDHVEKIAKENNLSEAQTAAYVACKSNLSGKWFLTNEGKGKISSSTLADKVCVCHSRTMVQYFKDDSYASHSAVVESLTQADITKEASKLDLADLKTPSSPEQKFNELKSSLFKCTTTAMQPMEDAQRALNAKYGRK